MPKANTEAVPTDTGLKIRTAQSFDLDTICAIESRSFPTSWKSATYLAEIDRKEAIFLVAEYNGEIVGFALSWTVVDEMQVLKIAVDESFRKNKVATGLMHRSIEIAIAKKASICFLEVRTGNVPAQKMYAKLGFKILGIRKGYYTDTGEDAIVLAAKIGELKDQDK